MTFFLNPWMLTALGAALLPALIEWLFRRRKRQVILPTLRFLLGSQEQKKVRRQDQILLLLRTLAIVFLVMAVARPLLQQGWFHDASRHVVVLLDGTASMNQPVGVTPGFALAQKKAAGMIRSLPQGTSVTVAHLGDRVGVVVEGEKDLHTAAARVEEIRAGSGAVGAPSALERIKHLLDEKSQESAELYLFSDFQKYTWQRPGEASQASQVLRELGHRHEIFLIDVGGGQEFNFLVTDLRPRENVLAAGMPVSFRATLESRGLVPPEARATVHFLVDGVKKDVREVAPGNLSAPLEFSYRFADPGEYLVEVLLEGDAHRIDNRRLYLCRVASDVRVLILDETAGEGTAESVYLARAIRPPSHPGLEKISPFDVKTIRPQQVSYENLGEYSTVVLAAMAHLDPALVGQLERYVSDGGNLWFFLGNNVNFYEYNKHFFKAGKGLLPSSLLGMETPGPGDKEVYPRYGETSHPALAQFGRAVGSPDAAFLRWAKLESAQEPARVVLALSNGVPVLLEKPFGQGKVLLANMTAGPDWTYWPALADFPILVHELLRYLVGYPDASVNLTVGDTFRQPVFVSTQHLLLRGPDGTKHRLTPERRPGPEEHFQVHFSDTAQPGAYQIEALQEVTPRRRFVVNPGPEEGDLERLGRDDFSSVPATWIRPEVAVEDFAANLHTVTELAAGILWGLAGLLAVESLLAWRFGRRRGEVGP